MIINIMSSYEKNHLTKNHWIVLENETGEIIMDQETINKARMSVEKMVAMW